MEVDVNQPIVVLDTPGSGFKEEVASQVGTLDLSHCFQCGVCSGSCPTMSHMEYGPRRILHMVNLGMADTVLPSHDIWMCVSCYSCSARCPQGIQITDIMATLRNMAVARGLARDKEATFSRVFVDVLARYGRLCEWQVLLRYYAAEAGLSSVTSLMKQAGLGLTMFRKGKLKIRPDHVGDVQKLREFMTRIGRGEAS